MKKLMLMLTACQPTPEQNIVIEKDTERMVEQSVEKNAEQEILTISQLVHGDRYVFEETGADDKLTLTMDAIIDVPNVDYVPITDVSMTIFTQEQVTDIFNYFYPSGEARIEMPQAELKSDLERGILEIKKNLADTKDETQRRELEEQIAWLEEAYLDAPEEQPLGNTSDGTLMTNLMDSEYGLELSVMDENGSLNIYTDGNAENPENSSHLIYNRTLFSFQDAEEVTYEEALATYESFLDSIGIDKADFSFFHAPSTFVDEQGKERTVSHVFQEM